MSRKSLEDALKIMNQSKLEILHTSFNTIYSLPLSGGYVGINFIPPIGFIQNCILKTEKIIERLIQNGIGKQIAWRYIIVGKNSSNKKD